MPNIKRKPGTRGKGSKLNEKLRGVNNKNLLKKMKKEKIKEDET